MDRLTTQMFDTATIFDFHSNSEMNECKQKLLSNTLNKAIQYLDESAPQSTVQPQ
jgi:hypothetical protein